MYIVRPKVNHCSLLLETTQMCASGRLKKRKEEEEEAEGRGDWCVPFLWLRASGQNSGTSSCISSTQATQIAHNDGLQATDGHAQMDANDERAQLGMAELTADLHIQRHQKWLRLHCPLQ